MTTTPNDILALCRHSLIGYAIAEWPGYQPADHHRIIADALQRVTAGTCKRLMIAMPPRHGKSMLTSEDFPPWYLGHHPAHQIIHATYSQDLADGFGRKVRNFLGSDIYQTIFSTRLATDSSAAARFHTTAGGVYHAVGVGGSATGRGADLLLIDDPLKNREEADSERHREKLKDWYRSVAYTRLMPGGAIVIIQTRWHEDDLMGWLLTEHQHEGWELLSMPAIGDDGAALWPESYPLETLERIRNTISIREWESLYQQRPRPAEGAMFKRDWLQYYTTRPDHRQMGVLMVVDPASGKRENNDYTSIWVVGLGEDENYYVLDGLRDRLNLTERAEKAFELHKKWRPSEVYWERYGMMADVEYIRNEMNRRNYRFRIHEVGGAVAKVDRVSRLIPLFQRGFMWFPTSLPYQTVDGKNIDVIRDFIEQEYLSFPVGKHDDMIDCLARIAEPGMIKPWPKSQTHYDNSSRYGFSPAAAYPIDPAVGY